MSTFMNFLTKFLDNTHLGKAATDLAPGFIIAVTILLIVGSFKQVEVFPYLHLATYETAKDDAEKEFVKADLDFKEVKEQFLGLKTSDKEQMEILEFKKNMLKEIRDGAKTDYDTRLKAYEDAKTLSKNIEVITNNFLLFLFGGLFIGILFGQVSGAIFYNGFFYRRLRKKHKKLHKVLYPSQDGRTETYYRIRIKEENFQEKLPDLQTTYYRYLEIATNMILPVLFLSISLIVIAITNDWNWKLFAPGIFCLIIGFALILNGRRMYIGYFIRKADVLQCLRIKFEEDFPGETVPEAQYDYSK